MRPLEVHRRIKKAIMEVEKESSYLCYNVEAIAERARTDTRTTRKHLELLEEDGFGKFCDPKKKTFSTAGSEHKLATGE